MNSNKKVVKYKAEYFFKFYNFYFSTFFHLRSFTKIYSLNLIDSNKNLRVQMILSGTIIMGTPNTPNHGW
jgi:hypothetical protein